MNISKYFFSTLLLAIVINARADERILFGDFGHEYTSTKNEPVWKIRRASAGIEVTSYGSGSSQAEKLTSDKQKRSFWEKMHWNLDSYKDAVCLSSLEVNFCYVPPKSRKNIDFLRTKKSDYFYYDEIAGVMEIVKIK